MRRFMVHLVTDVEFVDGDTVSDDVALHCQRHLAETVQKAANGFSLRTISELNVVSVQAGEVKVSL